MSFGLAVRGFFRSGSVPAALLRSIAPLVAEPPGLSAMLTILTQSFSIDPSLLSTFAAPLIDPFHPTSVFAPVAHSFEFAVSSFRSNDGRSGSLLVTTGNTGIDDKGEGRFVVPTILSCPTDVGSDAFLVLLGDGRLVVLSRLLFSKEWRFRASCWGGGDGGRVRTDTVGKFRVSLVVVWNELVYLSGWCKATCFVVV